MSFHQDFALLESTPDEVARTFIESLSQREKRHLAQEIESLLCEYPGKDQKGLRNAWFKLGAEWKGKDFDLRDSLERWIESAR